MGIPFKGVYYYLAFSNWAHYLREHINEGGMLFKEIRYTQKYILKLTVNESVDVKWLPISCSKQEVKLLKSILDLCLKSQIVWKKSEF